MWEITAPFRWEYGFQKHHAVMVLAILFGGPFMFAAYIDAPIPVGVGMASVLAPTGVLYGLVKASQDERVTITAWSFVGLASFSGFAHAVPGTHMQTTASIALMTASAVGIVVFSFAFIVALLAEIRGKVRNDGSGGSTAEGRVLTESEYEDFAPHPYENELSKTNSRSRPRLKNGF